MAVDDQPTKRIALTQSAGSSTIDSLITSGQLDLTMVAMAHVFATVYMCGLIWFVQLVHYPLHGLVGEAEFSRYQKEHVLRTSWVVVAPMLAEVATALLLLVGQPPGVPMVWLVIGVVLLLVAWIATAVFSVPAHARLEKTFSRAAHKRLVATNWVRTLGWSARAPLAIMILVEMVAASAAA